MNTLNRFVLVFLSLITCSCAEDGDNSLAFGFGFALVFSLIIFIVISVNRGKKKEAQRLAVSESKKNFPDFSPSKEISMPFYYLAIDDNTNRCLYVANPEKLIFKFSDIISAELCVDGESMISKQALGSTIGRSVVGAAIGGGIGAVIGGLTTSSKTKTKVSSILVHVILRNQSVNGFDIKTLSGEATKGDYIYKNAYDKAREILDLLIVAIDKANEKVEPQKLVSTENANKSIVDKLRELSELKKQGVITAEEFNQIKADLLSNNRT